MKSRTSLSIGSSINLFDDQGYLDLTKPETSTPQSAKCLPPIQVFSPGIPKSVNLINGLRVKNESPECTTSSMCGQSNPREYNAPLSLGATGQSIYRVKGLSPIFFGLEDELFKSLGKRAALFRFWLCSWKRRRGARLKPKFHMLLLAHEPPHTDGSSLSLPVRGRRGTRVWGRHSPWWRLAGHSAYSESMVLMRRQSHCIPESYLHQCCKM